MAIPQDLMSTTLVQSDWISPDDFNRSFTDDFELGPIALNDPSEGLAYQRWHLSWNSLNGNFSATPINTGVPVVVLNAMGINTCSFAFDQNAHINITYTIGSQAYLYWYDTMVATFVTTTLPVAIFSTMLTLDDKRSTQVGNSDIILWWTEQQIDNSYSLYRAYQRNRFNPLVPKKMADNVNPYLYKCGMNIGYRIQIGLRKTL